MIEFLEIFLFGQGDVQMAEPLSAMAVGSIITGGVQLLSGIFGGGAANRREKAARREQARLHRKLNYLELNHPQQVYDLTEKTRIELYYAREARGLKTEYI